MAHGEPIDEIRYGVGIFSGQGSNVRRSNSAGHLVSGRVVYTPVGEYQTSEVLVEPLDTFNLSFGAGAFYTNENSARDWAPQSAGRPLNADILSTTADAHIRWNRISAHISGFYRDVAPGAVNFENAGPDADPEALDNFEGLGATGNLGVLIIPRRLTANFRYSEAQPDLETDVARQREALAGVHVFHRGNNSRFLLEGGVEGEHDGDADWDYDGLLRLGYQLLF